MMRARVCPLNKVDEVPLPSQSRPICILSQIYRLYSAVWCSQVLSHWATWLPSDITGMIPSRSGYNAAYSLQTHLELAHFNHHQLAGITLDLIKCFNNIRHECARRLLLAIGLPPDHVNCWHKSIQRMTRFWEVSGQSFGPVPATCGLPEGDSHSVLAMICIAVLWSSNIQASTSPCFKASAYADNWSWHSTEFADHEPAAQITNEVTQICGLTIDWHKTWLFATNTKLANDVLHSMRDSIPIQELQRQHNARDLGFQMHYSGTRHLGIRKKRYEDGLCRIQKLSHLRVDLSTKEHVLQSGIYPAIFYGAELFPVSDDMLHKLRSGAAEALLGKSQSMSPAIPLLLTANTILDPGYYVVLQAIRTAMQWLVVQNETVQKDFFRTAAQFQGLSKQTKGPASTLRHYLNKFAWQIDAEGFVHVDDFIKLHFLRDSFQSFRHFLMQAWQKQLILTHTARHSLFHLPDISRQDTVTVLKKFSDNERRQLLRELAGAYQLESQKLHWTDNNSGACPFCGETDSRTHRLMDCPTFADTRVPFQLVLKQMQDEGMCFDEHAVVHYLPDTHFHHIMHFQQPDVLVPHNIHAFAIQRSNANQPFNIYIDGSCSHPSSPTTRYSAFAGVIDVATTDDQRRHLASKFLLQGIFPDTLQVCFSGRVKGEQSINRAELCAMTTAAAIEYGTIHSDSLYAVNKVTQVRYQPPRPSMSNRDVLHDLHAIGLDPSRVKKIKANRDLHALTDMLELYHALGNSMVDTAAKHTCMHLNKPWQQELEKQHEQMELTKTVLHSVMCLHVQLFQARSEMVQQMSRQESTIIPDEGKENVQFIVQSLCFWRPAETQQLVWPTEHEWFKHFSWGEELADLMLQWMTTLEWPTEPQGPFEKEIGVSWLELAVSFTMFAHRALPVIRTNGDGKNRLLHVCDSQDVEAHHVTMLDQATTMAKMWHQCMLWLPRAACPTHKRGLNTSLYTLGFLQQTSGVSPRPAFYQQDETIHFLLGAIKGMSNYNVSFHVHWLQPRKQPMVDEDWTQKCDKLKYGRRAMKLRR